MTPASRLPPKRLWQAIDIYLEHAYPEVDVPTQVAELIALLRSTPEEELYSADVFERHDDEHALDLRLGNAGYPHMKLQLSWIEGERLLLGVDTHDRHVLVAVPPEEREVFGELLEHNRIMRRAIESAWEADGFETFRSYLRADVMERARHADPR